MLTFTFQMHIYIPLNIYYFPQHKIKRTDAWFHVSRHFKSFKNILEYNICSSYKDEKIYEYTFMNVLNFANCLSLKIFSFEQFFLNFRQKSRVFKIKMQLIFQNLEHQSVLIFVKINFVGKSKQKAFLQSSHFS